MKKGFTLLELLIVIAILAILAAAAVVVLNPAELLRRARDSERITDLANIRNALNLYLTTVSSPDLDGGGTCGTNWWTHTAPTATGTWSGTLSSTTDRTTGGSGWIPVNLDNTAGGSPLSSLPIDPTNDGDNYYYYLCSQTSSTYELGTVMESATYANGGDDDIESTDGGNDANWYEVGNEPGLDLNS